MDVYQKESKPSKKIRIEDSTQEIIKKIPKRVMIGGPRWQSELSSRGMESSRNMTSRGEKWCNGVLGVFVLLCSSVERRFTLWLKVNGKN